MSRSLPSAKRQILKHNLCRQVGRPFPIKKLGGGMDFAKLPCCLSLFRRTFSKVNFIKQVQKVANNIIENKAPVQFYCFK